MTLFRRYGISSVKAFHKRGRPARINKLSSTTPVISPVCIIEYKTIFHQGGEASPSSNITLIHRAICLYLKPKRSYKNNKTKESHLRIKSLPQRAIARINKLSSTTPVISPVCIIEYKTIFHQGGEAFPFIEHYIDTQSHLPVSEAKEVLQEQQDKIKSFAYQRRTPGASYNFGDIVLLPNQACPKNTGVKLEFMPRHDGSFVFIEHKSPVSYSVANTVSPN
ncbi:hypothetical protein TNIN_20701 [Trichonephila inaurata madagascariensis]|uniref:Uncharacterized protein n=1 Tax=Trichonephila inaurata madagascariensis TaxID=2747483 RepID=A0A8X6IWN3_9ARAC|nr:hypothetical protein TNIN_20701 [Trichonephila inaurata madagascariensis]